MVGRLAVTFIVFTGAQSAGQSIAPQELAEAMAIGKRCEAPIIRVSTSGADFEAYIETPFARAALVTATALVMHQSLDAPGVQRALLRPGYRVWFVYKPDAQFRATITQVRVRSTAGELAPVAERNQRFFLGTVPSHGIIEALRARFPEFVFERLPPDAFVLAVSTSRGTHRFNVTQRERISPMRVCN